MRDATTAFEQYQAVRFFGSLNGLRCLCIALVLWHHSPIWGSLADPALILTRGFVGVDFFFVLSGFLITTLFLREEERNGAISLKGFYWRRILRIFPVYMLLVTLISFYWIVVKGQDELIPLVKYYYLFLANFLKEDISLLAPTWSLSVEEQYYLIWPLLLTLMPKLGRFRGIALVVLIGLCVASAVGALSFLGLRPIETEHAIWALPAAGYSAILLGSLMAVLLHNPKGYGVLYRLVGFKAAPVLVFSALLAALFMLPGELDGWPNLIMHSLMALCLVSIVIREDNAFHPVFAFRPVARFGEISYGIYLYHLIGLHVAWIFTRMVLPEGWASLWFVTVLYIVISYVISEISFRTYERYFLSLKDRRPFGGLVSGKAR